MKRLFVVVGHHRGGTSATAGALAHLGIDFGTNLMPPSPANPKGYFEDLEIVALHDRLLESMGCRWNDPPPGPDDRLPRLLSHQALEMAKAWLGSFEGVENVGVKDPRITYFPRLWQAAAQQCGRNLYVVRVHRPAPAVIASLARREGITTTKARILWFKYARALTRGWGEVFPQIPVSYPRLLDSPARSLALFADLAGSNSASICEAEAFLDPELNHHG